MKSESIIMGMQVRIEIADDDAKPDHIEKIFEYLRGVDKRFSTYKPESEINRINRGELLLSSASAEMQEVFALAESTCRETGGYFNIRHPNGTYDPSGLVKGWAIRNAAQQFHAEGLHNFYIDVGGDVEVRGTDEGEPWKIGVRNPFAPENEIIKVLSIVDRGIATSGTYARGAHIYDPHHGDPHNVVSITVVGPDVYEADRFATAAFAMGERGVLLIESLPQLEAYQIDSDGIARMTTHFEDYVYVQAS